MRRPPYHRDERGRLEVKMTPMIDVIFLLLIFFICTASFQAAEEVLPTNLSLPGALADDVPIDPQWEDLEQIVVKVLWEEGGTRWQINQLECRWLRASEAEETPGGKREESVEWVLRSVAGVKIDLPVILDVAGEVPLEHVIDVYDLCRQIGLERIQFAASVDD